MERDYNCFNCPHRTLCEKNNAVRHQCQESILDRIVRLKKERKNWNKKYKYWIKNLKKKYKELK